MHSLQKTWSHLVFTGDLKLSQQIGHSVERKILKWFASNTIILLYHHLFVNVLVMWYPFSHY